MSKIKNYTLVLLALLLHGCAFQRMITTPEALSEQLKQNTLKVLNDSLNNENSLPKTTQGIQHRVVPLSGDHGQASLSVQHVPLNIALTNFAQEHHYNIIFSDTINPQQNISISLKNLSPESIFRRAAVAAGHAAVIDKTTQTVTITDIATYTWRLPLHVMQRLSTLYNVGGNPISSSATTNNSSSQGGSSNSLNTMKAEFSITGGQRTDAKGLSTFLTAMAGRLSDVQVLEELGLVSVRGTGQTLARLNDFLTRFTLDNQRRVQIETSIIEVALTDEFQYGIDWTKILSGDTTGKLAITTAAAVASPAFSANVTQKSISSVINALQNYTNLRIISQPRAEALNHTPAQIFDGVQLPYVPSIQTNTTPGNLTGTTVQTTATGAFVVDGITLSIQPDILSAHDVQLTIIPVLSQVQRFETIAIGNNSSLTLPVQSAKHSLMSVMVHSGETIILGGIRSTNSSQSESGLPGITGHSQMGEFLTGRQSKRELHREVVILLRAVIQPSTPTQVLFSESL